MPGALALQATVVVLPDDALSSPMMRYTGGIVTEARIRMGWMGLPWKIARGLLGKPLSKGSILTAVGGYAAGAAMKKSRETWQKTENAEAILDRISSYDVSRGAGKLMAGWLAAVDPDMDMMKAEHRFQELLRELDDTDPTPEDRARTRMLLSKALFYMEGFRLSQCRYEKLQSQARDLLRKNPKWRTISRREVFLGQPFEPEELIGSTHRLLLMLAGARANAYLADVLQNGRLRDDPDYMARLIALTFNESDPEALMREVHQWCEDYRAFKLHQTDQQENMINTGLATISGELPAKAGMDLLSRGLKTVFKGKRKNR